MGQTFLITGCAERDMDWLRVALADQGRILTADNDLEEVLDLIDMMDVDLVFIGVEPSRMTEACALMEGMLEARPRVSVVAVGNGHDSDLVLAAMRAGARDFLTPGGNASEVYGLIWRMGRKQPSTGGDQQQRGHMVVLYGVDPAPDSTLVAAHLALALAAEKPSVLLVDMVPAIGEAEAILNIKCSFGLEDAMRAARRLDSTVIESAFSVHGSGLGVLPLLESSRKPEAYSYADTVLLLGALRQYFSFVVVNGCGQIDSDFIRALVEGADHLLWYIDQSVSCSRRNLACLQSWRAENLHLRTTQLLIDNYRARQAPQARDLAEMFSLPLAAALPPGTEKRLGCRNQGISLFKLAPRDELSRKLKSLAVRLAPMSPARQEKKGLLKRLITAER